jgi:hypothetical protein
MNVTSLPVGGANVRVYKTTANGSDFFATPIALTLGANSITVGAVGFDRAVKFQFSSGDVEFDALTLNGVESTCTATAVPGCTDATASNYDAAATEDDGSCTYAVPGCTDATALNYDAAATEDDGSCTYAVPGCTDATACNYDAAATAEDGSCTYAATGYDCSGACLADADGDGVCDDDEVVGCTDATACNYDAAATDDDASCTYADSGYDCSGACLADADGDGICDDDEIAGCTDALATNYDATATDDDGSCIILPTTQLQAADCNSTLNTLVDVIKADAVPGSEGYRFRLINGTDTVIVDRPFRALPLNLVSLDYLTTYNVDVAVTLNGSIGEYGTVCTISTPGPQTKLAGQYCGYVTDNLSALVYAEIVDNASNFRFRFINGNDTLIADRPFRNLPLNNIALDYDKTYNVDVQVSVGGVTGDFGDVCTVTTTFPTTQLAPLYCGITTNNLVSQVFAMNSEGATNFRFRFINGNDTLIKDRPFRSLYLNTVPDIAYGVTYNVDVQATCNGVTGDYGDVCTITTVLPTTQLAGQYCGYVTQSISSGLIKAAAVDGATNYRFRLINGNDTLIVDRPFRALPFSQVAVEFNKVYNVDVAATVQGQVCDYGAVCTVTTDFPTTKLADAYCGMTTQTLNSQVFAMFAAGATNYRFRFISGNDTLILDRPFRSLTLNTVPGITYDKIYNVDVQVTAGGVVGDYGDVCTVQVDFPTTQLAPLYCGSSPGSMSSQVFALFANGATNYRFRLINGTDTLIIDRPFRSLSLSEPGILTGVTYNVDIQVTAGGMTGDFGPVCTVTTPDGPSTIVINDNQKDLAQEEGIEFETTLSPNPFSDATTLHITSENASSPVSVSVYDGTGRLIESRLVDLSQETDVRIGTDYNPGFYQVIIIQDGNKKTARIVKQ